MLPISCSIGGFAADRAGNEKFFGGRMPSKPPTKKLVATREPQQATANEEST
jgi:hypothetical protein